MDYILSFLEGIVTFISPCILPMIPIYLLYFAGEDGDTGNTRKVVSNALGFVLGFTVVFVALGGIFAGAGALLRQYKTVVNIVTGTIVVIFGLNFTGLIKIGFLNRTKKLEGGKKRKGFFGTILLGIVFAIGWSPCVGTFLGTALMMASQRGTVTAGLLMLLLYSLGLGIPFILSAVLIDRLKGAFNWIKAHMIVIQRVCGILLIVMGVLMMTGTFSKLSAALV